MLQTQRRVTFHLPDGSQESCSDSGLGDPEPSSTASTSQPLPLSFPQEEYYEQTSPNSRTEGDGNSDPESSEFHLDFFILVEICMFWGGGWVDFVADFRNTEKGSAICGFFQTVAVISWDRIRYCHGEDAVLQTSFLVRCAKLSLSLSFFLHVAFLDVHSSSVSQSRTTTPRCRSPGI